MAAIINSFTNAFNTALQTGLNYKLEKMKIQSGDNGAHDDDNGGTFPIHFHDDALMLKGATYDNVAKFVNEYWPDATTEEKTEYYNSIKSGLESAQIFLQHCKNQDIQLRILQMNANGTVTSKTVDGTIINEKSNVFLNTMSEYYEKGKDLFKQATNVRFLGSIINIRNTSDNNGNSLDVSISQMKSNTDDFYASENYDGDGNNVSVYNKQSFTKFLPSSRYIYKTKSLQEILSKFTANPNWEAKKQQIIAKIADGMNMTSEELMEKANNIRCLSKTKPLEYDDILDFKAFKERCCGLDPKLDYPGTAASLYDTYVKLSTMSGETPYTFTLYGIFLLDKTVNDNINADLTSGEGEDDAEDVEYKYSYSSMTEEEVEQEIEDTLDAVSCAESRRLKIKAKSFKRMGIPVVTVGGRFVKEYKPGMKLEKGEKILDKKTVSIIPK